jgi:hypothetical protein
MLVAEIAEAKVKLAAIADEDQRNEAQEEIDGLQRYSWCM